MGRKAVIALTLTPKGFQCKMHSIIINIIIIIIIIIIM